MQYDLWMTSASSYLHPLSALSRDSDTLERATVEVSTNGDVVNGLLLLFELQDQSKICPTYLLIVLEEVSSIHCKALFLRNAVFRVL